MTLLNDPELLQEERRKAQALKERLALTNDAYARPASGVPAARTGQSPAARPPPTATSPSGRNAPLPGGSSALPVPRTQEEEEHQLRLAMEISKQAAADEQRRREERCVYARARPAGLCRVPRIPRLMCRCTARRRASSEAELQKTIEASRMTAGADPWGAVRTPTDPWSAVPGATAARAATMGNPPAWTAPAQQPVVDPWAAPPPAQAPVQGLGFSSAPAAASAAADPFGASAWSSPATQSSAADPWATAPSAMRGAETGVTGAPMATAPAQETAQLVQPKRVIPTDASLRLAQVARDAVSQRAAGDPFDLSPVGKALAPATAETQPSAQASAAARRSAWEGAPSKLVNLDALAAPVPAAPAMSTITGSAALPMGNPFVPLAPGAASGSPGNSSYSASNLFATQTKGPSINELRAAGAGGAAPSMAPAPAYAQPQLGTWPLAPTMAAPRDPFGVSATPQATPQPQNPFYP